MSQIASSTRLAICAEVKDILLSVTEVVSDTNTACGEQSLDPRNVYRGPALPGTVILKLVRSNRCIGGKPQGLRIPILTFTEGNSNGKISVSLSVLFASPRLPNP